MGKRTKAARRGALSRKTRETAVAASVLIEGSGRASVETGIGFFDHMLALFASHGCFDVRLRVKGDTHVDLHHTVEDTGISLGRCFMQSLRDKRGITRYGYSCIPMDEALCSVSIDISDRPCLCFNVKESGRAGARPSTRQDGLEISLLGEFLKAFSTEARMTVHVNVFYWKNLHHLNEVIFKALGRALRQACEADPRRRGIPSTKGLL